MKSPVWGWIAVFCFLLASCTSPVADEQYIRPIPQHVILLGIDGLSPAGIAATDTPHIDRLRREGASSLTAQAVIPTISSPNWASMISGVPPSDHGIFSNLWFPFDVRTRASYIGSRGRFPTLFGELRDRLPEHHSACFLDWGDFANLIEEGVADTIVKPHGAQETMHEAIRYLGRKRPELMMIHIDLVDAALHGKGYLSTEYITAVQIADALTGQLLDALDELQISDKTLLILTSDHGGKDFGHGGNSLQELNIPWIMRGTGVLAGLELSKPVRIYDTAPTVLYALGIDRPSYWSGIPVEEAFKK